MPKSLALSPRTRAFLREEQTRIAAEPAQTPAEREPLNGLFERQLGVLASPLKRKALLCGGRAGKTELAVRKAASVCMHKRHAQCCFVGITRTSAKNNAWEIFRRLNRECGWGFELNESELRARLPNGSWFLICGSDSARELEKFRGVPWDYVAIDECGSHRPASLKYLVVSVLEPRLMDRDGELWLLGTPTPQRWGFFYDVTTGSDTTGQRYYGWAVFHWDARENPHIDWERFVLAPETGVLARNGWTLDSALFRREYLGEWVVELSLMAFRFERERNVVADLPQLNHRDSWRKVMAIDFGVVHATAYTVIAEPQLYGRRCYPIDAGKRYGLSPSEAGAWLKEVIDLHEPDVLVGDLEGLGKGHAVELANRFKIYVKAAQKDGRISAIEVASDMLHTGQCVCIDAHSERGQQCSTRDLQAQLAVLQRDEKTGDLAKGQDDDVAMSYVYAARETLCYANRSTAPATGTVPAHALDRDELDPDDLPRERHYLEVDDVA